MKWDNEKNPYIIFGGMVLLFALIGAITDINDNGCIVLLLHIIEIILYAGYAIFLLLGFAITIDYDINKRIRKKWNGAKWLNFNYLLNIIGCFALYWYYKFSSFVGAWIEHKIEIQKFVNQVFE